MNFWFCFEVVREIEFFQDCCVAGGSECPEQLPLSIAESVRQQIGQKSHSQSVDFDPVNDCLHDIVVIQFWGV